MCNLRPRAAILALLFAAPLALAAGGDTDIKNAKARAAMKKYDRAVEKADAAHHKALSDAGTVLLAELDVAKREAMRAENLPDATAIQEVVDRRKAELAALGAGKEKKSPNPRVLGRWRGQWQNEQVYEYTFTADGRFMSSGGASLAFDIDPDGAAVLYSERDPRHDFSRFTPVGGDRLLMEA